MSQLIGETAGKIWIVLGERGETSVPRIPQLLKVSTQIAYQAIGWLAREGKVNHIEKDGKTFISLTREELDIFTGLF